MKASIDVTFVKAWTEASVSFRRSVCKLFRGSYIHGSHFRGSPRRSFYLYVSFRGNFCFHRSFRGSKRQAMGARGTSRKNSFPRRDASVESALQSSITFPETGPDVLSAEAFMVAAST